MAMYVPTGLRDFIFCEYTRGKDNNNNGERQITRHVCKLSGSERCLSKWEICSSWNHDCVERN